MVNNSNLIIKSVQTAFNINASNTVNSSRTILKRVATSSIGQAVINFGGSIVFYLVLSATIVSETSIVKSVTKYLSLVVSSNISFAKNISKQFYGISTVGTSLLANAAKLVFNILVYSKNAITLRLHKHWTNVQLTTVKSTIIKLVVPDVVKSTVRINTKTNTLVQLIGIKKTTIQIKDTNN